MCGQDQRTAVAFGPGQGETKQRLPADLDVEPAFPFHGRHLVDVDLRVFGPRQGCAGHHPAHRPSGRVVAKTSEQFRTFGHQPGSRLPEIVRRKTWRQGNHGLDHVERAGVGIVLVGSQQALLGRSQFTGLRRELLGHLDTFQCRGEGGSSVGGLLGGCTPGLTG
nr:hypothetical protein [Saccharomonospora marina]